jgi:hypothetical protein
MMLIVINSILGQLNGHFVTFWPSTWSWAADGGGVNELDESLLWRKLKRGWGKSAPVVCWVGVIAESLTHKVNVFATFNGSHVWVKADHLWLFEVSESEIGVRPIDTIQ